MNNIKLILQIAFIIFLVEGMIMLCLKVLEPISSPNLEALIDATILALLVSPIISYWVVKPYIEARNDAKQQQTRIARYNEVLLNSAAEGIFGVDLQGHITFINPAATKMIGHKPQELIGRSAHEIFHHTKQDGDPYPIEECPICSTNRSRNFFKADNEMFWMKDGTGLRVEFASTPIWEEDKIVGTVVTFRDIMARKQLEELLLKSRNTYRTLVDNLPQRIYYKDNNSVYISGNRRYADDLGISLEELPGKTDFDFFPRELAEQYRVEDQRIIESGEMVESEELYLKIGKNCYINRVNTPLKDKDGNPTGVLGIFWEITEQKLAEQRLYDAIICSAQWIWEVDVQGHYTYVFGQVKDILGYTEQEMLGKTPFEFMSPEEAEKIGKVFGKLVAEKAPIPNLENWNLTKDGEHICLLTTGTPLLDPDGNLVGYRGVNKDITKLKREDQKRQAMEIQLIHAKKLESVGQLAAGIAHEINTPVQFVSDNTRFLQEAFTDYGKLIVVYDRLTDAAASGTVPDELLTEVKELTQEFDVGYLKEEIPQAINQSLEGLGRIAKIVQAMKEFSHPGTESKTPTDLNRAIETTINVSRNEWKYSAEIITELDPALPQVPVLAGEFNQVMLNLIVNAAHAITDAVGNSGKQGEIRIATRQDGEWVEIRVSDTGKGIPETIIKRIFDPFYTTKEVGKGSGQGLAIAWSVIVDKHGGTIEVESEEGKGSTFIIRLPVKQ